MRLRSVKVGCDPEFVIVSPSGKVLHAHHFSNDGNRTAPFGDDGSIFELRPAPSTDIFRIIRNIHSLLHTYTENYPWLKACKFIAGQSYAGHALGGHIHISSAYTGANALSYSAEFQDFIDAVIGSGLMESIDDKRGRKARQNQGYGDRGEFRSERHILEYRTPPSWLTSPSLAFLFLAVAKVCGLLFVNRDILDFDEEKYFYMENTVKNPRILKTLLVDIGDNPILLEQKDIRKCVGLLEKLVIRNKIITPKPIDFKTTWLKS